jgi:hypothetical protein
MNRSGVFRKNFVVLGFRLLFTPVVRQNYFVSRINRLAWAGFTVKSAGTWSFCDHSLKIIYL